MGIIEENNTPVKVPSPGVASESSECILVPGLNSPDNTPRTGNVVIETEEDARRQLVGDTSSSPIAAGLGRFVGRTQTLVRKRIHTLA